MSFRLTLVLLGIVVLLTGLFATKGALQDVHWDAPIYLSRSRAYAESNYLAELAAQARATAEHLRTYVVDQGDTAYWGFTRIGNVVVLGTVTSAFGANLGSLAVAHWLYCAFMAGALVLAGMTALGVMGTLGTGLNSKARIAGVVLSGGLYAASDVYRYMSGNLVADLPSLFFLTASSAMLVRAVASGSLAGAAASGVLGFLAYATKMDMVWVYVSFLLAYGGALLTTVPERRWLRIFLASAGTALAAYCVFAVYFWPLPDPRLFILWTKAQVALPPNPYLPLKAVVAAGGMLWIGLLLAAIHRPREKSLWVAFGWLTLLVLPYVKKLAFGEHTEVRYFVQLLLPLMVGSTVGWAAFTERFIARRVRPATCAVLGLGILATAAISHAETYGRLRELPGGWRLQYVRTWLGPPRYERPSYPVVELGEVARFVSADSTPVLLLVREARLEEFFSIISFLAPRRSPVYVREPDVPRELVCGPRTIRPRTDPVMYCLLTLPPEIGKLREAGVRVLELRARGDGASPELSQGERLVFTTGQLAVLEIEGAI